MSLRTAFVVSLLTTGLAGCATPVDPYSGMPARELLTRTDDIGDCMRKLRTFDAFVDAAALRDAEAARVAGFPFLRVDRFTADWVPAVGDKVAIDQARFDRMVALDGSARYFEEANAGATPDERIALAGCRERIVKSVRSQAESAVVVARVPDDYDETLRVVGLYPVTKVPFSWGLASWQQGVRDLYATPFPEVAVAGRRVRYTPEGLAAAGEPAGLLGIATVLKLPAVSSARAWQLLQQHAPVLVVDTVDANDQVGILRWQGSGPLPRVGVDVGEPVAYARVAWTVINNKPSLQLVYTFWFPARRATHPLDIAAGRLDAIVWRVTLDAAARPLVYDSIHACGCYHLFFPTERVRERPGPHEHEASLDETMFSPQVVRAPGIDERIIIYVGARDHGIQRVAVDLPKAAPGIGYRLLDENALRALALPPSAGGGTRSVYGPDGLVPGSERPERFVYWPMGIPSSGQMRQWGHHATALIGRRHFDDPRLFDRYFTLAPGVD